MHTCITMYLVITDQSHQKDTGIWDGSFQYDSFGVRTGVQQMLFLTAIKDAYSGITI